MEAQAEAEAIKVTGEAEAYAIEAKARAEAEQMAKKADAWKEYQDAAIVDMILEAMPKVRQIPPLWLPLPVGYRPHAFPSSEGPPLMPSRPGSIHHHH